MAEVGAASQFTFEIEGLAATVSVARFEGDEAISELFRFEIVLTSHDEIACADVLGKKALLTLLADKSEPRHVHGIVSRFEQGDEGKRLSTYRATLVPDVWRLQHRHDARIFQDKTVPEIVEAVLQGAGLSAEDYRLSIEGTHPTREYCVQYRESDWAFINRLMEEEGICCFFEHGADKDVLVMGDGPGVHAPITAPDTLAYRGTLGAMAHGESVSRFSYAEEVRPGKVTLGDFNFKKPSLSLAATSQADTDTDLEIYDHPGEYVAPGDGTALAKIRLEEWRSVQKVGEGDSGCMRFTPGYLFTLSEHTRDACNRRYLVTRVHHRGSQAQMGEVGGTETPSYSQSFEVIPDDVPYRPTRWTPRPTIRGAQTAIVVGPSGEEIHTDEHGRVKVQFHWDRLGKRDEKSSCWIRVSQLWAGAGWGAMWIPRIGHEVIVEFIEGNPDRPIIVGRVYHGANVPPYPLPAEKTKSTIKSDTSPGGGGSNELRFEDKAGSEEIYLHGQKDWNIKIENDKAQVIGHDESLLVQHDRSKEVSHDQSEVIGNNKTIDVGKDHSESIGANESIMIGADAERTVSGNQTTTIGGKRTTSIADAMDLSVGGASSVDIGGASSESVGGAKSVDVSGDFSTTVGKAMQLKVSKDSSEKVGGEKKVEVTKTFTLVVGEGSVTVEKNGNITIKGKDITLKGTGKINVQGGGKIVLKSDGPVDVEAASAVKIKGSAVNMN